MTSRPCQFTASPGRLPRCNSSTAAVISRQFAADVWTKSDETEFKCCTPCKPLPKPFSSSSNPFSLPRAASPPQAEHAARESQGRSPSPVCCAPGNSRLQSWGSPPASPSGHDTSQVTSRELGGDAASGSETSDPLRDRQGALKSWIQRRGQRGLLAVDRHKLSRQACRRLCEPSQEAHPKELWRWRGGRP